LAANYDAKKIARASGEPMALTICMKRGKNGPPTIPSLPVGPEVLFFSPKVEDTQN
jgi:hypothetical protein